MSNGVRKIKNIVVLIHGIRTQAEWQEEIRRELLKTSGVDVIPIGYGWFHVFRFLLFGRKTAISEVKNKLNTVFAKAREIDAGVSIISHSFGTHIISDILANDPHFRLEKLILCGSVVRRDYDWASVQHKVKAQIINDCGTQDIFPVLAAWSGSGYGASGRYGFKDPALRDRYHDIKHSEFLNAQFCSEYWTRYINEGVVVDSVSHARPERWLISILTVATFPVIVFIVTLGIAVQSYLKDNNESFEIHPVPDHDNPLSTTSFSDNPNFDVSVKMDIDPISRVLEQHLPSLIYRSSNERQICVEAQWVKMKVPSVTGPSQTIKNQVSPDITCDLSIEYVRNSPILAAVSDKNIMYEVFIKGTATVRGHGAIGKHIFETINSVLKLTFSISPTVNSDWTLDSNASVDYAWVDRPTATLFDTVSVDFNEVIEPVLDELQTSVRDKLDQHFRKTNIRESLETLGVDYEKANQRAFSFDTAIYSNIAITRIDLNSTTVTLGFSINYEAQ